MKLLFISLFFVSLLSIQAQTIQEADVSIPFYITFNNPPYPMYWQDTLFIGIDSIATDSIDTILGEVNLPPIPPPGFAFVLDLPYNNFSGVLTSFSDYRYGTLPYTGTAEYRVRFWTPATIHWQLPEGVTGQMQDIFTGTLINVFISGTDSFYVSNPFNKLRLLLTFNNYIPVELTSFTAFPQNNSVNLSWQTATETNNSGFKVERRKTIDERSEEWNTIGFVSGNGTTTEPQSYSFVDENLSSGIYKYRLKQIDYDGTFTYLPTGQAGSNEIEVEITPSEFALEQNYPNPFNPSTSIQYAIGNKQFVQLKVYDVLGNEIATLVNEEKSAGSYEVEFDVAQDSRPAIASGIYFYKLQAGEFIQTKKMILIK